MTAQPVAEEFGLDAFLGAHRGKDVLRFITCGSVDDGKSTLIGRLLHDTKQIFDDQITTLAADSKKHGTQGAEIDFALLVDGLSAEREQGITIDVAYRFFSTEKRSFIVADTPGHEQYTRNMATGASNAELAILLIDARKGLTRQTKRHSLLVSMLGIKRVVLAINKMDLKGWSETTYRSIIRDYAGFAANLGFSEIIGIPVSARGGDNVARKSEASPWYSGPSLLDYLEQVPAGAAADDGPFRFPIQWVARPDADFRGYSGTIASGKVAVGDRLRVLPSGSEARVARIVTYDGDLDFAVAGQSITLTLDREIDASRGDLIAGIDNQPLVRDRIEARIFWTADRGAKAGDALLLKLGATQVTATIESIAARISPDTMARETADAIAANDIVDVALSLDRRIAFDTYARNRETGGFILIDRETSDTAAMGLVLDGEGERQRKLVLVEKGGRDAPAKVGSPRLRRAGEALSWTALGLPVTATFAFAFTGDLRIALAIGLADAAVKLGLYGLHRRVWSRGESPAQ
jgi:sulfate adenylyltransferase large subunit